MLTKKNLSLILATIIIVLAIIMLVIIKWNKDQNNFKSTESLMRSKDKNNYSSIMDVMLTNKKYTCWLSVKDDFGIANFKITVEGKKYSTVVTFSDTENISREVFNGDSRYSWGEEGEGAVKRGFYINRECIEEVGKNIEDELIPRAYLEKDTLINCQPTDFVDFNIPDDIEFRDECGSFQKQYKQPQEN